MCVAETLRAALNALAVVAPQWLRAQVSPDWYERYGCRIEDFRWPQQESRREAIAVQIGTDGYALLQTIFSEQAPTWLRQLPAVEVLRRVWVQQYSQVEGQVCWRANDNLPPASLLISSPYDPEAHFSVKRTTSWTGFKVHVTETCDEDRPHLITHVETTSATTQDKECTADIQQALADKRVLPSEHFMDTGSVDGEHLVSSRAHGIDLVGPVTVDPSWQAKAGQGFDATKFTINWQAKQVSCPQGQSSRKWKLTPDRNATEVIRVECGQADCLACPVRGLWTTAVSNPRQLTLRPQARYEAIQALRQVQTPPQFKERSALRAGIEGTLSQGIRAFGLRQARYLGQAQTHLQQVFTATALNVTRLFAWLDDVPFSPTRISSFAALAP